MASMMDEMAKTLARRRERIKDTNVSQICVILELTNSILFILRSHKTTILATSGRSQTRYRTS